MQECKSKKYSLITYYLSLITLKMINQHKIYLILAADQKLGIGKDGQLPWHFSKELKYFQEATSKTKDPNKQNIVLMGRTTWESIPENHRPLKGRKNIVLTRNLSFQAENVDVFHSLDDALESADDSIENIYIIGGGKVFAEMMERKDLDGIYLTRIHETYDCDTYFEFLPEGYEKTEIGSDEEKGVKFDYLLFEKN